jgi:hypothetical protein
MPMLLKNMGTVPTVTKTTFRRLQPPPTLDTARKRVLHYHRFYTKMCMMASHRTQAYLNTAAGIGDEQQGETIAALETTRSESEASKRGV